MKNYQNPFKTFKKHEWAIWLGSLVLVTVSFMFPRERDYCQAQIVNKMFGMIVYTLRSENLP